MSSNPKDLEAYARFEAELEETDPDRYVKKIKQESSFNPKAISPKGARGLAQFMPATGKGYGLKTPMDFHDPFKSLEAGAKHTKDLEKQFGDPKLALIAYNAGPGAVERYKRTGKMPAETRDYIKKIDGSDEDKLAAFERELEGPAPQEVKATPPRQVPTESKTFVPSGTPGMVVGTQSPVGRLEIQSPQIQRPEASPVQAKTVPVGNARSSKIDPKVAEVVIGKLDEQINNLLQQKEKLKAANFPTETLDQRFLQLSQQKNDILKMQAGGQPTNIPVSPAQERFDRSGFSRALGVFTERMGITDAPIYRIASSALGISKEASEEEKAANKAVPSLAKPITSIAGMLVGMGEAQVNEFKKAQAIYNERHKGKDPRAALGTDPEMMAHYVAAFVPFFGPQAAEAGEMFGEGDVSGGIGATGAILGQELLGRSAISKGPKPQVQPKVPAETSPGRIIPRGEFEAQVQAASKPAPLKTKVPEEPNPIREAKPNPTSERGLELYKTPEQKFQEELASAKEVVAPLRKRALEIEKRDIQAELEAGAAMPKEVARKYPDLAEKYPDQFLDIMGETPGPTKPPIPQSREATPKTRHIETPYTPEPKEPAKGAAQAKPQPESRGRVVTVGDETVTLTPEQEAKWTKAEIAHKRRVEYIARNFADDPEQLAKQKKAAEMVFSAEKRQITGLLTGKEQKAKAVQEKKNFTGKEVEVAGRPGKVISTPFGKVKVQFEDGTTVTVPRERVLPRGGVKVEETIPTAKVETPAKEASLQISRLESEGKIRPEEAKLAQEIIGPPPKLRAKFAQGTPKIGERSFPKTLDESNLPSGAERNYEIVPHRESWAKAQENIKSRGLDGAAEMVRSSQEASAEVTATAIATIDELAKKGETAKAAKLAEDISIKLTQQGQAISAAAIASRNSPSSALLTAKRISKETGKPLSPKAEGKISRASLEAFESQKGIDTSLEQLTKVQEDISKNVEFGKNPLATELSSSAKQARLRLGKKSSSEAGVLGGSIPGIGPIQAVAIVGAEKMAKEGLVAFNHWSKGMIKDFGKGVEPHLNAIYRESWDLVGQRAAKNKAYQLQSKLAAIQQKTGGTLQQALDIWREHENHLSINRKARGELAREFSRLEWQKTLATEVLNVISIPKTFASSLDVSMTARQGLWNLINHPKASSKAYTNQWRALVKESNYETIQRTLEGDPWTGHGERFGLHLPSQIEARRPGAIGFREEYFQSALAEKLTGGKYSPVRASNRAATAFLDTQRVEVFKLLGKQLENAGYSMEKNPAQFKALAEFVNLTTARGLNKYRGNLLPYISAIGLFSPRNMAARFTLLNPIYYAKLPPGVRKIATKEAVKFYGALAATLGIASTIPGVEVSADPDDPNFGYIKVGNKRFDITGGFRSQARLIGQLGKRISTALTESDPKKKQEQLQKASMNLWRFTRGKMAPPSGTATDIITGETFLGEPTTLGTIAKEHLGMPFGIRDFYEVYKEEGLAMGLALAPIGGHGVGIQVYEERQKKTPEEKKIEGRMNKPSKSEETRKKLDKKYSQK